MLGVLSSTSGCLGTDLTNDFGPSDAGVCMGTHTCADYRRSAQSTCDFGCTDPVNGCEPLRCSGTTAQAQCSTTFCTWTGSACVNKTVNPCQGMTYDACDKSQDCYWPSAAASCTGQITQCSAMPWADCNRARLCTWEAP